MRARARPVENRNRAHPGSPRDSPSIIKGGKAGARPQLPNKWTGATRFTRVSKRIACPVSMSEQVDDQWHLRAGSAGIRAEHRSIDPELQQLVDSPLGDTAGNDGAVDCAPMEAPEIRSGR